MFLPSSLHLSLFFFLIIYLFIYLAVLNFHWCAGLLLAAESRGCRLAAGRLLVAVASVAAERGL